MRLRSEQEIINSWKYIDNVYISVICMTYNQEAYIEATICSLLMQEIECKFEIIIHDDASTDSTYSIIQRYAKLYPHIIKVIRQTINQYSIKPTLPTYRTINETSGRYIAICEGDDYWLNVNKLQLQFAKLEDNSTTDLCFHAYKYDCDSVLSSPPRKFFNEHVSLNEIALAGGGGLCTASLFFRKKAIYPIPDFFLDAPVGDFFIQVLTSLTNGAIYLDEELAAYRVNSVGSWSESIKSSNVDYRAKANEMICSISALDTYLSGQHKKLFSRVLAKEYQSYALKALKNGCSADFKILIQQSWQSFRFENNKQVILFLGRFLSKPLVLSKELKIKLFFKSNK